jgi:orotate phosphoribosyltransferase
MGEDAENKQLKTADQLNREAGIIPVVISDHDTRFDKQPRQLPKYSRAIMRKPLFQLGNFKLHSGGESIFKIDCDVLSDEDWECIAALVAKKQSFKEVIGIPKGGLKFAKALEKYCQKDRDNLPTLIADDVLTTGTSMGEAKAKLHEEPCVGVVLFARGECPWWVVPVFTFDERLAQ